MRSNAMIICRIRWIGLLIEVVCTKILGSKKNPILFGVGMLANKLMKLQLWGSVWIGNLSGFSTFQEYRIKIAYEKWKRCIT